MYTDQFFRFPIKIYDGFSVRQVEKQEDLGVVQEATWYEGWATMPIQEIRARKLYWYQAFSVGHNPDEEGFDITCIQSEVYGHFSCTWPMEKFEKELNKFVAKWETEPEKKLVENH